MSRAFSSSDIWKSARLSRYWLVLALSGRGLMVSAEPMDSAPDDEVGVLPPFICACSSDSWEPNIRANQVLQLGYLALHAGDVLYARLGSQWSWACSARGYRWVPSSVIQPVHPPSPRPSVFSEGGSGGRASGCALSHDRSPLRSPWADFVVVLPVPRRPTAPTATLTRTFPRLRMALAAVV